MTWKKPHLIRQRIEGNKRGGKEGELSGGRGIKLEEL